MMGKEEEGMLNTKFGRGKGQALKGGVNDLIMTPCRVARNLISTLPISADDFLLDPFRGGGAFYDNFPTANPKDWCEISKGKDFLDYNRHVDWVISNPPYSIFDDVLEHSFKLANNVALLVPLSKVVSSMRRIRQIRSYGGAVSVLILSASTCGFPFGFPACFLHIRKDYKGNISIQEYQEMFGHLKEGEVL